jgi:hypothetical protein
MQDEQVVNQFQKHLDKIGIIYPADNLALKLVQALLVG